MKSPYTFTKGSVKDIKEYIDDYLSKNYFNLARTNPFILAKKNDSKEGNDLILVLELNPEASEVSASQSFRSVRSIRSLGCYYNTFILESGLAPNKSTFEDGIPAVISIPPVKFSDIYRCYFNFALCGHSENSSSEEYANKNENNPLTAAVTFYIYKNISFGLSVINENRVNAGNFSIALDFLFFKLGIAITSPFILKLKSFYYSFGILHLWNGIFGYAYKFSKINSEVDYSTSLLERPKLFSINCSWWGALRHPTYISIIKKRSISHDH